MTGNVMICELSHGRGEARYKDETDHNKVSINLHPTPATPLVLIAFPARRVSQQALRSLQEHPPSVVASH